MSEGEKKTLDFLIEENLYQQLLRAYKTTSKLHQNLALSIV